MIRALTLAIALVVLLPACGPRADSFSVHRFSASAETRFPPLDRTVTDAGIASRLYEDVRGAKQMGMRTVQAFWFRADDDERGIEPDFEAFTPMDVLNVVRRLTGET